MNKRGRKMIGLQEKYKIKTAVKSLHPIKPASASLGILHN